MKRIITFFLICLSFTIFWWINISVNYSGYTEIKKEQRYRPEFLPSAQSVSLISTGFDQVVKNYYLISLVQYIGANFWWEEYKEMLYTLSDLITDLDPYFEYLYEVSEILLVSDNAMYEVNPKQQEYSMQAAKIGKKAIKNLCDPEKVQYIKDHPEELVTLKNNPLAENPCVNPYVPLHVGFVHYYGKLGNDQASLYYRISAAHDNAPEASARLATILQGKSGTRRASTLMWLQFLNSGKDDNVCFPIYESLEKILSSYINNKSEINTQELRAIEKLRIDLHGVLDTEEDGAFLNCADYVDRIQRELNISYISSGWEKSEKKIISPAELVEKKYIEYIPKDYQIFGQEDEQDPVTMIYLFNEEKGIWDYKRGKYSDYSINK